MAQSTALLPPPSFEIHDRNAAELWKEWRQRWSCYAAATELEKKKSEVQVAILLTVIGPEAHKVYNTFKFNDVERNLTTVLDAFEHYCQPLMNTAFERYRFNLRGQRADEQFEQYVTALRQLALRCDFENITPDQILRDRIMFGITDNKVRDRLLREKGLTLERTLEICRAHEISTAQQKEVNKINDSSIHAIGRRPAWKPKEKPGKQTGWITDCKFCGRNHKKLKEECAAYGKTCSACKRPNHFKVKCPEVQMSRKRRVDRGINSVTDTGVEDDPELQVFTVRTVSSIKLNEEQTVTLKIREKCYIRFQIDCGADCNVLPVHVYKAATGDKEMKNISPSDTTLYVYGQIGTKSAGRVKFQAWRGSKTRLLECELIDGNQYHSILGCKDCVFFEIIEIKDNDKLHPTKVKNSETSVYATQRSHCPVEKGDIVKQYPSVFKDTVGKLDTCYKIRINESVAPVQHPPRRVPAVLRLKLQDELNHLEKLGIIAKVEDPTDWVSSLVVVPKKEGKLRICLDPRDLNVAIKRERYQLPTIEDIATRLAGARVFTVLDVKQGFWHIPLEEESSYLTTFNSPFGRYRWLRMPFGISSAPEVFQRSMHQLIEDLDGIEVIADDFMVFGRGNSHEEAVADHDSKLHAFLK